MTDPWETTLPVRLEFPLGDGNWDKRFVTLLLHESGEVTWDAEGFKERETEASRRRRGPTP